MVSGYVKEAFPNSFTKRLGQSRLTMILGIKPIDTSSGNPEAEAGSCNQCIVLKSQLEQAITSPNTAQAEIVRLKQDVVQAWLSFLLFICGCIFVVWASIDKAVQNQFGQVIMIKQCA